MIAIIVIVTCAITQYIAYKFSSWQASLIDLPLHGPGYGKFETMEIEN